MDLMKILVVLLFITISSSIINYPYKTSQTICDYGSINDTCTISTPKIINQPEFDLGIGTGILNITSTGSISCELPNYQLCSIFIDFDQIFIAGSVTGSKLVVQANQSITLEGVLSASGRGWVDGPGKGIDGVGTGGSYGGMSDASCVIDFPSPSLGYGRFDLQALEYGSGGGKGKHPEKKGGRGGGIVVVSVPSGQLYIGENGEISSNGGDGEEGAGTTSPGGGSGGSIYIAAKSILGSGKIEAKGGASLVGQQGQDGSGGGGGRIVLNGTVSTGKVSISVAGGPSLGCPYANSGTGTIYFSSNDTLIYQGYSPTAPCAWSMPPEAEVGTIFMRACAILQMSNQTTCDIRADQIVMDNNTQIIGTKSCDPLQITVKTLNMGSALIYAQSSLAINTTTSYVAGQIVSPTIEMNVETYLEITENGTINANGLGYPSGTGPGAPLLNAAGAGHGSQGGMSCYVDHAPIFSGGASYGSFSEPMTWGSGGGDDIHGHIYAKGGAGGGRVRVICKGNLLLNGDIEAKGADGECDSTDLISGGGGSGGSLYLDVLGEIRGNGELDVSGGSPCKTAIQKMSNHGAGGRMAIGYRFLSPNVQLKYSAGPYYCTRNDPEFQIAGPGTLYLLREKTLILDGSGQWSIPVTTTFPDSHVHKLNATGNIVLLATRDLPILETDYFIMNNNTQIRPRNSSLILVKASERMEMHENSSIMHVDGEVVIDARRGNVDKAVIFGKKVEINGLDIQPDTRISVLSKCLPGYIRNPQSYECEQCPIGTYQYGETCTPCKPGEYNDAPGATECKKCKEGFISTSPFIYCAPCPAGTFWKDWKCTPCPPGYYNDKNGALECKGCSEGTYAGKSGYTHCLPCAEGTFAPEPNATTCEQCGGNFFSGKGAKQCEFCRSGFILVGGKCWRESSVSVFITFMCLFAVLSLILSVALLITCLCLWKKKKSEYTELTDTPEAYQSIGEQQKQSILQKLVLQRRKSQREPETNHYMFVE